MSVRNGFTSCNEPTIELKCRYLLYIENEAGPMTYG